jgi:hypothetical protein
MTQRDTESIEQADLPSYFQGWLVYVDSVDCCVVYTYLGILVR